MFAGRPLTGKDTFGAPLMLRGIDRRPYFWYYRAKKVGSFLFLAISWLAFHILKTWWVFEYALVFILIMKNIENWTYLSL